MDTIPILTYPAGFFVLCICGIVCALKRDPNSKRINAYLLAASLSAACVIAELISMVQVGTTDMFWVTPQTKRWYEQNWLLNSKGYRDREWEPDIDSPLHKIVVVGDSFAAGAGIADPKLRFSDQLEKRLGTSWRVFTLARLGWGPVAELDAIENFSVKVDTAILSYYANDFADALSQCGREPTFVVPDWPTHGGWLLENSYFVSYLYWRYLRTKPTNFGRMYASAVKEAFAHEGCRSAHQGQLTRLISGMRRKADRVFAVIFPDLADPVWTASISELVTSVFNNEELDFIDLGPLLKSRNIEELTINSMDIHPSALLHHEVGDLLYQRLARDRGFAESEADGSQR